MSNGQRVRIKECDKDSKIKPAPSKVGNKALPLKNKVVEACTKLIDKVILKDKALEDKSRSVKLSPRDDDPKRALKINMGGNAIRTSGVGCVLTQSSKPEGGSLKRSILKRPILKRSIKTNIGRIRLNPNGGR